MLIDGRGVAVDGANVHDQKLLAATLDAISVDRPQPTPRKKQHLCLDKAYSGKPCRTLAEAAGYTVHVPDKANAKKTQASAGPPQSPPLDCRSSPFMAQSLSAFADSLGEESLQLSLAAVLRLRHHLLA